MANTIQRSRYWRFKVIEKDAVDGWEHMVLNYPTIISPKHTRDAKPEFFKQNDHKTLRKADKLDPFYYVFYLDQNKIDNTVVKALADSIGGTEITLIPDQSPYDWDLKQALRKSAESNYNSNYAINKFQTGNGVDWDNSHTGYYYYLRPHYYSKNQLIEYRYWTKKCLDYLPSQPDDQKKSAYSRNYYDVYSEDTILPIEYEEPVASIIAKKKKRLTDKDEIEKAKKAQEKRRETLKRHEQEKLAKAKQWLNKRGKNLVTNFKEELAEQKIKDGNQYELGKIMKYMAILNHIAKTLQDIEVNGNLYTSLAPDSNDIIKLLQKRYKSSEYVYNVKDKLINRIITENFVYGQSTNPYIDLKAVIPPNADKIYVRYCYDHNEMRQWDYEAPQDFYYENQAMIDSCPECQVSRETNYYAFYYLSVNLPSGLTDFHVPYPIGQSFMPVLTDLPRVNQTPNIDGGYLFGREADDDELLLAINIDLLTPVLNYAKQYNLDQCTPEQRQEILTVLSPRMITNQITRGNKLLQYKQFLDQKDRDQLQTFHDLNLIKRYNDKQYKFVLEKLDQFKAANKTIKSKLLTNTGYCLDQYVKKYFKAEPKILYLQPKFQDLMNQVNNLLDNWPNVTDKENKAKELKAQLKQLEGKIKVTNHVYNRCVNNTKDKLPTWSAYMPKNDLNTWTSAINQLKPLIDQPQTNDVYNQEKELDSIIKQYQKQNRKYRKIEKLHKRYNYSRKTITRNINKLQNALERPDLSDKDHAKIQKVLSSVENFDQLNIPITKDGMEQLDQIKKPLSHTLVWFNNKYPKTSRI